MALEDRSIAAWQAELLDLAYRGVSKFPLDPHVKNRSRAQGKVIDAALTLGQGKWAEAQIPAIKNWRRGVAFADLAYWCVANGVDADIDRYLSLARQAADGARFEGSGQVWRRDRVLARIARVEAKRGKAELLDEKTAATLDKSAWRYLADAEASKVDAASFDASLERLDGVFAQGDLDLVRHAHEVCLALYERFYADRAKRDALRARVTAAYEKLPLDIRVDLMLRMAAAASSHDGKDEAHAAVKAAQELLGSAKLLPEHEVPLRARVAAAFHAAGDAGSASAELAKAEAVYAAGLDSIVNIYRAGCLRAIAEAHHAVAAREKALAAYKRCVEAGMENPNSRPRADDFSATCISLAVEGCEPDAELRDRLEEICRGLGTPW